MFEGFTAHVIDLSDAHRESVMGRRREFFTKLLCKRDEAELLALFERPAALIDLEISGFADETDYKDIISEVIKTKQLKDKVSNSASKRIKRALDSIANVRENCKAEITPAMDGFLADIAASLKDGEA